MTKHLVWLAVLAAACGGKKHDEPAKGKGSGSGAAIAVPDDLGSGVPGQGSGMEGSAALHLPTTPAARAKQFEDCWALWSAGRFDALANCYALDAKVEAPGSGQPAALTRAAVLEQVKADHAQVPDQKAQLGLELVSSTSVIAVVQVSGTGGGKPFGVLAGEITDFDDHGMIAHEQTFMDAGMIAAQLGGKPGARAVATGAPAHEVVVAKSDDTEKSNLEVFRKVMDAFDKHDVAAYTALLADNMTWSESVEAKDGDRKALVAGVQQLWKDFPDAHADVTRSWAAGDYVAAEATLGGSSKGKGFSAPALLIYKLGSGKVTAGWLFFQSAALQPH